MYQQFRWRTINSGATYNVLDEPSDYDQYSSDEEGLYQLQYDPSNPDDPVRYENSRTRQQVFTDRGGEGEQNSKKIKRVYFYRNGDAHFKPKQEVLNPKSYLTFDSLLNYLSKPHMVPMVAGVKYIFELSSGQRMDSLEQFKDGQCYVCSSVNRLKIPKEGFLSSGEQPWKGGKLRHDDSHLLKDKHGHVIQPTQQAKPLILTVISNTVRESEEKWLLNPRTRENFEDALQYLENMVVMANPPVTALYTEDKPHVRIESFSELFREVKERDCHRFLVCGKEGEPREPRELKKRPPPSSDSSSDSFNDKTTSKLARPEVGVRPFNKRLEPIRMEIDKKKRELFLPSVVDWDHDGSKPDQKLALEWVYGYRGRDVKQNLVYLPNTGELVYFVASVVVLYDRKNRSQKHYTAHTEEITSLALHPYGPFIATGQVAGKSPEGAAHVRVWDAFKLITLAVIGTSEIKQGVSSLAFSAAPPHMYNDEFPKRYDLLMVIDDSDKHVMTVWDWRKCKSRETDVPLTKTTTTASPVVSGAFNPFYQNLLITFGKQHLYFWKLFPNHAKNDTKAMRDTMSGIFEGDVPKYVTSLCFGEDGDVITGDSSGSILVWHPYVNDIFRVNMELSKKSAHTMVNGDGETVAASVSCLVMLENGDMLSAGGSEIKVWDTMSGYTLRRERLIPEEFGVIRTLIPQYHERHDGFLFIGTAKNVILEGTLSSKFKILVQGHSEELWAVKAHPLERSFFTAGQDSAIIKWSAFTHRPIWRVQEKKPFTCMAIDAVGELIAAGSMTGKVFVYGTGDKDRYRKRTIFSPGARAAQAPAVQIDALSFTQLSADNRRLAVGCRDGYIHIYNVTEDGQVAQYSTIQHKGTFIMDIDWTEDGRCIQAVLGNFDLVFWDVWTTPHTKSGRIMRDAKWATLTCPIGYPLIGVWQGLEKDEVVNTVCRHRTRSKSDDLLLVGDSRGRVRLYRHPAVGPRAEFRQVKYFSSNCTAVEFLSDEWGCLATGGNDAALMQFAFEYDTSR